MDNRAREAYEEESLQLRAELKAWEGEWATAHRGKKPGRDDIKQNPDIGASQTLLFAPFAPFAHPVTCVMWPTILS